MKEGWWEERREEGGGTKKEREDGEGGEARIRGRKMEERSLAIFRLLKIFKGPHCKNFL